jgi:hypothetical protein
MNIPVGFIRIIVFFNGTFEYGDGEIFRLLTLIPKLYHSRWDHEILYADRSSNDKHILIRPLLQKTKHKRIVGG